MRMTRAGGRAGVLSRTDPRYTLPAMEPMPCASAGSGYPVVPRYAVSCECSSSTLGAGVGISDGNADRGAAAAEVGEAVIPWQRCARRKSMFRAQSLRGPCQGAERRRIRICRMGKCADGLFLAHKVDPERIAALVERKRAAPAVLARARVVRDTAVDATAAYSHIEHIRRAMVC